MKQLLLLIFLALGSLAAYGQWNSMGLEAVEGEDYDGHNLGGGSFNNPTTILLTVNGQNVTDESMSADLGYYFIYYYKFKKAWYYETIGDIVVTDTPIDDEGNAIDGTKVSFTDADYSSILTTPKQWGMWETIGIIFDWSDFASGDGNALADETAYWEVIIVNKKSGYCVSSGRLAYEQEVKLILKDPTLQQPSGPTLAVNPIIAGCWAQGGTFDLTQALVSKSPESATVEYYTDANGTTKIADPTKAPMPASNLSVSTEVKKYYARAIDGADQSDIQEIAVTFYQKPDVALALSDRKTTVCYNVPIVLQTENKNGFTPGRYHYVSRESALDVDVTTASYATTSKVSTMYYVYVTSGNTVGNCKDTASVDITVTPAIGGGNIQITANPDKSEICAGESVELTVSLSDNYAGTVVYQWGNMVPAADRSKTTITVTPASTTEYTVDAQLNGCSSIGSGSKLIVVNPLPALTVTNPAAVCGGTVDITQSGNGLYHYYTDEALTNPVADATAVAAGSYYVTLTDNKGCISTPKRVTATVNTPPSPKILVNGAVPVEGDMCAGTEITLSCDNTGYAGYTWTGGSATANAYERKATIVAGSSNIFTLEVRDANGCTGTATQVAITGKAAPTVTIDPVSAACAGSDVTLTAHPSWVGGAGTVSWTGSVADATAATTTATLAGGKNSYSVVVTDQNKCTATASIEVVGNTLTLSPMAVDPKSLKAGSTVSLDITASWNGVPLRADEADYDWKKIVSGTETDLATTKSAKDQPDANTTYKVTVTKEGCEATAEDNVTVLTDPFNLAGIDGYRAVCDGEDLSTNPVKLFVTASGGQKNYTYEWTVPNGMTVEATNTDTLKITAIDYSIILGGSSEMIRVTVSDASTPVNTASKTLQFEVRQLPQITINGKSDGESINACKDITTALTASVNGVASGVTYSWSTGATGAQINAATATAGTSSYTVTATYAGCSSEATVDVTVNELPELALTATLGGVDVTQVCPGAEITLTASVTGVDNPNVVWGKGANGFSGTTPTTNVNGLATYEVKYTDATTACTAVKEVSVDVYPVQPLAIGVTPGTTVCAGSQVVLTASNGASYQWSADGTELAGETNAVLTVRPTAPVVYTASGKDANGCDAKPVSATISITPAPTLALSSTTMDGCVGSTVDLANAVNRGLSTPSMTLRVKDAGGNVLSGTTVNADGVYTLYLDGGGDCPSNEETVTVTFHALPNVTFLANKTDVCSGETVTLTAGSDASGLTFTYAGTTNTTWTDAPTNTGNSNTTKTYTVTAKDSYGCKNTADATVTVKPLPDIQITNPGAVCASSEVTLTASGADSYSWTGDVNPGSGATYTVRPTATNKQFFVTGTKDGCENTADITLEVLDAPVLADARELAECVNGEVDLKDAFTTGYTLTFFDENQDALTSTKVVVSATTTYYVKATVGTCSTDFKPITVTAKPLPTVSIVGNNEVCAGVETTLTATGTGVSYIWNPGAGEIQGASLTINPTTPTTYTVRATGGNNCTAEAEMDVNVNPRPVLGWDVGNPSSLIAGESKTWNVRLTTPTVQAYTYTWLHNGTVDGGYTNANYHLTGTVNPELLEVFVTDGKGCVSDTISTSVPVTPQGGELTVTLAAGSDSEEICQGGVQILTATPAGGKSPYKYVWYKDDAEMEIADDIAVITVSDAATYKVVVSDAGTPQQSKMADVSLRVSATQTAPAVVVPDLTIPTGNSTLLLAEVTPANGSYAYQWAKAADLKDAEQVNLKNPETKLLTGDTPYEVIVKDGNGCYALASGTVRVDDVNGFIVLATAEQNKACIGNTVQLNATLSGNVPANVTYEWIPADGLSATNVANPKFVSSVAGEQEYIVKVTSDGGYVAVAKVNIEVENKTAPTLQLTPTEDIACAGQQITVTAQGGTVSEYQWIIDDRAPISGGATLDTLAAGNRKVKVTATAQNGCVVSPVEVEYRIHELPVVDWDANTPSVVDKGTNLTVTAIADNGAVGDYTYNWNVTGGTANGAAYTVVMNSLKTFKVSVTNDQTGCTSSEISKTITVRKPSPDVEIAVRAENVNLCQNGIGLLEVTSVKGGEGMEDDFAAYTYAWTVAGDETVLATEKSYVATTAGVYTVKVTEPKTGKSAIKDITVVNSSMEAPQVVDATLTVAINTQAYLFASVTGGTPEYSYNWAPMSALATSNTRVNPTTSALSAPETFTCYVTDANGCSGMGQIQVDVVDSSDPKLFTLAARADNTNPCVGNTIHLTATPSRTLNNPTYEWTPATDLSATDIANPTFTANKPATVIYTVKATEQDGYSVTAQVAVTVKSTEVPRLELADAGECAGEKLTVENKNTTVTVANYHWIINDVPDNTVTGSEYPLGAGQDQTVKVYANATNGCVSDTVSGVYSRKPAPTIAWDQQLSTATEGDDFTLSVTAEAGVTYVWKYVYTSPEGTTDEVEGADMEIFEVIAADKGSYAFTVYVEKDGCRSETLEHTVNVLEKGVGLAVTTDVTNKQICENGSAVVTATGHNGSGTYTYTWYAGTSVSGTPVATGATAILSPTVNGQKYVVEVNDGVTTAVSSPITLTFNSNMAPVIAGGTQNVAAGHATILLSQVTQGNATGYHWSSPNNLLATGEETKAYPSTMPLSDNETFTYYVTDANGCVSKPAEVSVEVDESPDALAIEVTADMTDLCRGNVSHLNVVVTQGSLSETAVYEWIPSIYLTDANTAHPEFAATVAGDYTYLVKVTEQGKVFVAGVDLTVKAFEAPEFAWDPTNPKSYEINGSFLMKTTVTKETTGPYSYHWLKPREQTVPLSQYSVQTATEPYYDFAVVMSDANGCQTTDTLKAHISTESAGGDEIEIKVEDVNACAVAAGRTGTATLSVTKIAGPDAVTYAWKANGNSLPLSDENTANATVDIAGAAAGLYSFTITVSDAGDNTNKVEESVLLTIAEAPNVSLAEHCVALHKDSVFVLTIANSDECDYLWQQSVYGTDWETPTDKGTGQDCEVTMGEQDMRYILIATNTESQCSTNDTAMIYRIPDAPKVEIDTNLTHLDIKLSWGNVTASDGYTVWSRKWDPYCLTTADGGAYTNRTSTTRFEWAVDNMDTLEFFYVTADKNVCGTTYYSQTSDTVGYKLDVIAKHPEKTSNSHISWLFDMSGSGVANASDVLKIFSDNACVIRAWEQGEQDWLLHQTLKNPLFGIPGFETEAEYVDDFTLKVGEAYQFDSPEKEHIFLQYGKLPEKFSQTLSSSEKGTNSIGFLPFHYSSCLVAEDLLRLLDGHIVVIRKWDYTEQDWLIQILKNPLFGIPGFENEPEFSSGKEILLPGMVLQIDISELPQYIWK